VLALAMVPVAVLWWALCQQVGYPAAVVFVL